MGDLAENFNALREFRAEEKNRIEPSRFKYATEQLEAIGCRVTPKNDGSRSILVEKNGLKITFFPYSGWASGRGITDGRGIHNLINQLKEL